MRTKPHKEEMIRFAKSEYGTAVWFRPKTSTNWRTLLIPTWDKDCIYVLDDEYAELRKKSVDEDRPIQVYNNFFSTWDTPTKKITFDLDIKLYRLEPKEEEFKYPIYKRSMFKGFVVEFTSRKEGMVVIDTEDSRRIGQCIGYKANNWAVHTDTNAWEDYEDEEPIYYYRWEKLSSNNKIRVSDLISDKYAEKNGYKEDGWIKIINTKRTWEY